MTNGLASPQYLLIIDIDGRRQDVFHQAWSAAQITADRRRAAVLPVLTEVMRCY